MATTDKNIIKSWFETGKKPTQEQFWAWMDSYRHNNEQIPITAIEDIVAILNAKAEAAVLTNHLTDPEAHAELFIEKENKSDKGVANGYVPLDGFRKILIEFLNVVNDLTTGGTEALLTAEQGKVLQLQIDGINTILSSDDVDLDSVQELVDAIKEVETSLETILVNDVTTGGVTKALTAEMGRYLKDQIDNTNLIKANKGTYSGSLSDLKAELDEEISDRELDIVDVNARIDDVETEFDMYQLINNQIYVDASGPVLDSWHGKLVTFTASVTITVPSSGLRTGFNFEGIVDPTITVNTAMTAPKSWYGGYTGAAIPENSIFTFIQRSNDLNKISIYGL